MRVLAETARPETGAGRELVAAARARAGAALGLPAERMLREDGMPIPPSAWTARRRQADAAQVGARPGRPRGGGGGPRRGGPAHRPGGGIVEADAAGVRGPGGGRRRAARRDRALAGLLPDHERILAGIREASRRACSPCAPATPRAPAEANGTVGDNAEEARTHLGLAREKLDRSVAAFLDGQAPRGGPPPRARSGTTRSSPSTACRRSPRGRRAWRGRWRPTGTSSPPWRPGCARTEVAVAGDPRTREPTVASFEEAQGRLRAARGGRGRSGRSLPRRGGLLAARAPLDEVHAPLAPADRDLYAEAGSSVEAAGRAARGGRRPGAPCRGGRSPTAPRSPAPPAPWRPWPPATPRPGRPCASPHGDWEALDAEADRIAAESARLAATLRGEIELGEAAVAAIAGAAANVRNAEHWTLGRPGVEHLAQARSLLDQGRYRDAALEAETASQTAAAAYAAAMAEQRRRQQAESSSTSRLRFGARASGPFELRQVVSWGGEQLRLEPVQLWRQQLRQRQVALVSGSG